MARNSLAEIPARSRAFLAASMDMVITSSSSPGTAFSLTGKPEALPPTQTRAPSFAGGQTHVPALDALGGEGAQRGEVLCQSHRDDDLRKISRGLDTHQLDGG